MIFSIRVNEKNEQRHRIKTETKIMAMVKFSRITNENASKNKIIVIFILDFIPKSGF